MAAGSKITQRLHNELPDSTWHVPTNFTPFRYMIVEVLTLPNLLTSDIRKASNQPNDRNAKA